MLLASVDCFSARFNSTNYLNRLITTYLWFNVAGEAQTERMIHKTNSDQIH